MDGPRSDGAARGRLIEGLAARDHARLVRAAARAGAGAGAEDAVQEAYRALLASAAPLPAEAAALRRYAVVAVVREARRARPVVRLEPYDDVAHGADGTAVALPVERAAMARTFLAAWYRSAGDAPARAGRVVVGDALAATRDELAAREGSTARAVKRELERHRDAVRGRALALTGHVRDAGPASIFGGLLVRLRELPLLAKAALVSVLAAVPTGGLALRALAPTPEPAPIASRAVMPSPRPAPTTPTILPRRAPAPAPSPRIVRRPPAAPTPQPVARLRRSPQPTRQVPVEGIPGATRELPEASAEAPLGDVGVPGL